MNNTSRIIHNHCGRYFKVIKDLVAINSVYSNKKGIKNALLFCKNHFEINLKNFNIYFDKKSNLICVSKLIDRHKDILYFSAHIDTVPANHKEWDKMFSPFTPYEDEKSIVGRGSSDDKSGVAYQLFFAELIRKYYPNTSNIVFTISSREEQGGISAREIGNNIGKILPIGKYTYIFTLENNTQIAQPPTLYINFGEQGAIAIEIIDTLDKIRKFLIDDNNLWNPTVIVPHEKNTNSHWEKIEQKGGHAASVIRKNNLLFRLLLHENINHAMLAAGDFKLISSIPEIINKSLSITPIQHKLILDLRTMKRLDEVKKDLDKYNLNYRFIKSLDHGYNLKDKLFKDKIYKYMNNIFINNLQIKYEVNPGSTDSGTIYNSISPLVKENILPIVLGPGSRSQRNLTPPRLTHGVNETFDKHAGLLSIEYITKLINRMNLLNR